MYSFILFTLNLCYNKEFRAEIWLSGKALSGQVSCPGFPLMIHKIFKTIKAGCGGSCH